ncbi:hypothetical protein BH10CYA1_BH10CYA1_43430 [soil metagenome]
MTLSPPISRTPSGYVFADKKDSGPYGSRWLVSRAGDEARLADFVAPDDDPFLVSLCTNSMCLKEATSSPFTVNVLEGGWLENGDYYQVLDLSQGAQTLEKKPGRMPEEETLALGLNLVRALKHLHKREFVHAAICPEVVYAEDGKFRLGEFWWAHTLTGKTLDPDLFQFFPMNVFQSALRFFAPEVLLGFPPARESDLYSVGALMFYLLTGETPCKMPAEIDPVGGLEALSKEQPRSILKFRKDLANKTVGILEKLLDRDADNRSNIFRFEDMLALAVGESPPDDGLQ